MEPEKKLHGALIGSIIIIVILIIGGIYIWQTKVKEIKLEQQKAQMQAEAINAENQKELNTLEQDLNSTNTDIGVDAENIQ